MITWAVMTHMVGWLEGYVVWQLVNTIIMQGGTFISPLLSVFVHVPQRRQSLILNYSEIVFS